MNYTKIYWDIIRNGIKRKQVLEAHCRSANREGFEIHHAIPKFMGGKDCGWNRIPLTTKEHAMCHLIMYKIQQKDVTGQLIKRTGLKKYCRKRIIGYALNQKGYRYQTVGVFSHAEAEALIAAKAISTLKGMTSNQAHQVISTVLQTLFSKKVLG